MLKPWTVGEWAELLQTMQRLHSLAALELLNSFIARKSSVTDKKRKVAQQLVILVPSVKINQFCCGMLSKASEINKLLILGDSTDSNLCIQSNNK